MSDFWGSEGIESFNFKKEIKFWRTLGMSDTWTTEIV
jgi:hypothetical protein